MSQRNVERIIGMLATDEALRARFSEDPRGVLGELSEKGIELNGCEVDGLASVDPALLARFADALHPCLQKSDLHRGDQ